MVRKLRNHPCIICWICQNEPMERADGPMHAVSPGPQLEEAALRLDPSRPVIRSSDVDDASSGDSHNWSGALDREVRHYQSIRGTTEKLNTEFGFDAPPAAERARAVPEIAARLEAVLPRVAEIHDYQYHLTKYFIEHYRRQKYDPCAGYFQFMWIDLSPQSFYGIYDWWGLPKSDGIGGGLRALEESNQPLAVLMDCEARPAPVWVVNDTLDDVGECRVAWTVLDARGGLAGLGSLTVAVGPDCRVRAGEANLPTNAEDCREITLALYGPTGTILAQNRYRDPVTQPPHPEGHPQRMDHELGMRLYWAQGLRSLTNRR
jgi:beta-mannosidase